MHSKELIEKALRHPKMTTVVMEMLDCIKRYDKEMYEDYENEIYFMLNGYHFNEMLLEKALISMENVDGSKGAHWSLSQTKDVMQRNRMSSDKFNEYDFNYVMNMMYSDYVNALGREDDNYIQLSKAFLMDPDAPDGKALRYYMAMKK